MRFTFDFNLSVWVRNLEIEAESLEVAKEKFSKMSADDLLQNESVSLSASDATDIDITTGEYSADVKVTNIKYEPNWWEFETEAEKAELISKCPTELQVKVTDATDDDIRDKIEDAIMDKTDLTGNFTFEFEILKQY